MKKVVFVVAVALALFSFDAGAQTQKDTKNKRLEFELGVILPVYTYLEYSDEYYIPIPGIEFEWRHKTKNDALALGVHVSFSTLLMCDDSDRWGVSTVPVMFVMDHRIKTNSRKITPFVGFGAGVSANIDYTDFVLSSFFMSSFMLAPRIGIRLNNKINFTLGYQWAAKWGLGGHGISRLYVTVGFRI